MLQQLREAGIDLSEMAAPTEATNTITTTTMHQTTLVTSPVSHDTTLQVICNTIFSISKFLWFYRPRPLPRPSLLENECPFASAGVTLTGAANSVAVILVSTKYPVLNCRKLRTQRYSFLHNCDFLVIQVVVLYKQRVAGKYTRYAVEISSIYKSRFSLLKREYVWFSHSCCSRLRMHRRYLLMGRKIKYEIRSRNQVR